MAQASPAPSHAARTRWVLAMSSRIMSAPHRLFNASKAEWAEAAQRVKSQTGARVLRGEATMVRVSVKRSLAAVGLLAVTASLVWAQSPTASANGTINGKSLAVRYSAPSVRGRQIFGAGGLLSKDPTYPA